MSSLNPAEDYFGIGNNDKLQEDHEECVRQLLKGKKSRANSNCAEKKLSVLKFSVQCVCNKERSACACCTRTEKNEVRALC